MLASRSGVRGSRRKYEEKHNKAKDAKEMKFKMNYMNLIRYGESVRVGEACFFYRLNYRDIFTLNSIRYQSNISTHSKVICQS